MAPAAAIQVAPSAAMGIQDNTSRSPQNATRRLSGRRVEGIETVGRLAFHEGTESLCPTGMPELPQGLGLYLTDALARHAKVLTDFLEGVVSALVDPEPEPKRIPCE